MNTDFSRLRRESVPVFLLVIDLFKSVAKKFSKIGLPKSCE
jgi:hypothetical protein